MYPKALGNVEGDFYGKHAYTRYTFLVFDQ